MATYTTSDKKKYDVQWGTIATGSCSSSLFTNFTITPPPATKKIMDELFELVYNGSFKDIQHGILFVSPVNYNANGRAAGYWTSNFVHWLIETGKGIVCASPVFANPSHGLNATSSLCQTFTWTPQAAVDAGYVVEDTGGVYNIPDKWKKSYNKGLHTAKVPFDKLISPFLTELKHFAKARDAWDAQKAELIAKLKEPVKWKAKRKAA